MDLETTKAAHTIKTDRKVLDKNRRFYYRHRQEILEHKRKYRQGHPEQKRIKDRIDTLRIYGLTPYDWDQMLKEQSGRCAICESPMKNPHVDHCHATGRVRGLLCMNCNIAIGKLQELKGLHKGIRYLEQFAA